MKTLLSFADVEDRVQWLGTPAQQLSLLNQYNLDGFEVIWCDQKIEERFPSKKVFGIHLPFYADWMSFWLEDHAWLDHEFGARAVWEEFFQGKTRDSLIHYLGRSLEYADSQNVEYVIFHVSQVSVDEAFDYQFMYDDETVLREAIKLINTLLDPYGEGRTSATRGRPYQFHFLMENLWWPGLNLQDASMTRFLLDSIHYEKKGLVVDLGHLLNANPSIRTPDDAIAWIHQVLNEHEDLLHYMKAVHLHQSLTGEFVEQSCAEYRRSLPPTSLAKLKSQSRTENQLPETHLAQSISEEDREPDYYDRYRVSYEHVAKIDRHEVWEMPGLQQILDRINPEYLIYEFRSTTKEELFTNLRRQNDYFGL